MFDILPLIEVTQQPDPDPEELHWSMCGHCRDMATDIKKVGCRQAPEHWISNMAYYKLDEGVLRLARGAWNDIFAINDHQEPGEEQRQYRHSAYRQFVLWQHGRLGIGNRVVIPSCCIWKISPGFGFFYCTIFCTWRAVCYIFAVWAKIYITWQGVL